MKKKKETATGNKEGTESSLELKDCIEDTSGRDVGVESCDDTQDVEDSTPELKDGTKEASKGEAASFKVCKHQDMLQEEEDRPNYNPHQGGHSWVVHMLHSCHIAQLSWVPFPCHATNNSVKLSVLLLSAKLLCVILFHLHSNNHRMKLHNL